MQFKNQLINALTFGALGALAVLVSVLFHLPTWVLFLGWISYSLFGNRPKKAINTFVLILLGVGMSILIEIFGKSLAPVMGETGILLAVFVIVGALTFLEDHKWFGNLAAYFFGMIIYFGMNMSYEVSAFIKVSLSLALGLSFAWISMLLRKSLVLK